jgi:2,3-diaminopropionate biosynthesis protein SbnB
MSMNNLIVLTGNEIVNLTRDREFQIVELVKEAYKTHNMGKSSLPHSSFLRFPDNKRDRIIALPAYLGGDFAVAGIKWISSFPKNIELDMERASAVLILNSTETGSPRAVMESSVINAKRTAASAALAADYLLEDNKLTTLGLIGCGLINFETLRFILTVRPEIQSLFIHDLEPRRVEQFRQKCLELSDTMEIVILQDTNSVIQKSQVISLATTASEPHIFQGLECHPEKIVLHTSLRDLAKDIILAADNIVDDIDHCCRAQTSVHLAEQHVGNRDFIRCTIGDILNNKSQAREKGKVAIYQRLSNLVDVDHILFTNHVRYRRLMKHVFNNAVITKPGDYLDEKQPCILCSQFFLLSGCLLAHQMKIPYVLYCSDPQQLFTYESNLRIITETFTKKVGQDMTYSIFGTQLAMLLEKDDAELPRIVFPYVTEKATYESTTDNG